MKKIIIHYDFDCAPLCRNRGGCITTPRVDDVTCNNCNYILHYKHSFRVAGGTESLISQMDSADRSDELPEIYSKDCSQRAYDLIVDSDDCDENRDESIQNIFEHQP
ncbi:MAG: hypothetical protein WC373_04650 [Smithella sp.]